MDKISKSYLIYSMNGWFIALFFVLGFLLPFIINEAFLDIKGNLWNALYIVFPLPPAYFISRKLGLYPIRVQFDKERMKFEYLTKDLKKVKDEIIITTKNITGFSDYAIKGHDVLKLHLSNGRTFDLDKNGFFRKTDDFEILILF